MVIEVAETVAGKVAVAVEEEMTAVAMETAERVVERAAAERVLVMPKGGAAEWRTARAVETVEARAL